MVSENKDVIIQRQGHVLLITLNRPEARNAINLASAILVGDALETAEHDPEIRVVVITGAGDQVFCAGGDLKALARGEKNSPSDPKRAAWGFAGVTQHPISKPIIAAVNGAALGGGAEMILAFDLVVASETAIFGWPEVKRGVFAGAGGAFRLGLQIPFKIAMELMLTGDSIDAARAYALGLVNEVVPQAKVLERAMALANKIAVNAPLAVQASKRIARGIKQAQQPQEDFAWEMTRQELEVILVSEDAKEGPRAFAEKRAPVWKAC